MRPERDRPRERYQVSRVHSLRAGDAPQLCRLHSAERFPVSLEVVTLDERLADAMRMEGFVVVDVAADPAS